MQPALLSAWRHPVTDTGPILPELIVLNACNPLFSRAYPILTHGQHCSLTADPFIKAAVAHFTAAGGYYVRSLWRESAPKPEFELRTSS